MRCLSYATLINKVCQWPLHSSNYYYSLLLLWRDYEQKMEKSPGIYKIINLHVTEWYRKITDPDIDFLTTTVRSFSKTSTQCVPANCREKKTWNKLQYEYWMSLDIGRLAALLTCSFHGLQFCNNSSHIDNKAFCSNIKNKPIFFIERRSSVLATHKSRIQQYISSRCAFAIDCAASATLWQIIVFEGNTLK